MFVCVRSCSDRGGVTIATSDEASSETQGGVVNDKCEMMRMIQV